MEPLVINIDGFIMHVALEGHVGKLVAFDSKQDKAILKFVEQTFVAVTSEMIWQDEN